VSPVRYELGFSIPEDRIVHSHRRENIRAFCGNTCNPMLWPQIEVSRTVVMTLEASLSDLCQPAHSYVS
jgi:hypothetical protein